MSRLKVTLGAIACAAGLALAVAVASIGAVPAATAAASGTPFQVYWTNQINGTIGAANLDGSNLNASLISGATVPQQMAVVDGRIYWVNGSTNGQSNGSIGVANLDGSDANQSLITGLSGPTGVTAYGNYVYWTSAAHIGRANLNGSGVNTDFITTPSAPFGIVVTAQHIYWTSLSAGSIGQANLDGSDPTNLITGITYPVAAAVSSSHIYWTDGDYGQIGEANLNGSGVNARFINGGVGGATQIAIDSNHLYWLDYDSGHVDEANLDGSGVTTLFASGAVDGEGLAIPVTTPGSTTTTSTTTTSTTTTTTTTPTTPTTTTAKLASATSVICNLDIETGTDDCGASVADAAGGTSTPTGTVQFSDGGVGTLLGSQCQLVPTPGSEGIASCDIQYKPADTTVQPSITANYLGDSTFASSSAQQGLISGVSTNDLVSQPENACVSGCSVDATYPNEVNPTAGDPEISVTNSGTQAATATDTATVNPGNLQQDASTVASQESMASASDHSASLEQQLSSASWGDPSGATDTASTAAGADNAAAGAINADAQGGGGGNLESVDSSLGSSYSSDDEVAELASRSPFARAPLASTATVGPSPALVLAALSSLHPSAGDTAALKQEIALATAPTYSQARAVARVTLLAGAGIAIRVIAHELGVKKLSQLSHLHAFKLASVHRRLRPHAKTKLTLKPSALGAQILRYLAVVGLGHKVTIENSIVIGPTKAHPHGGHVKRSIKVL